MRIIPVVLALLFLVSPTLASGQTFAVHGSAGPTLSDQGHSLAAGLAFSPASRVTLTVDLERTHLPSRIKRDEYGNMSAFRGGTLTVAAAELRVALFGADRIGPYGLVGMAAGVSRPNVNALFPSHVTNEVRAPFAGGGIRVPFGDRVSFFADARLMLVMGKEADELFAVAPIRAGIAWRF